MATDEKRPALRAGSAVVGYVALLLGYFAIGTVTQVRDVIAGLWVTEALAIALPAVIAVRGANLLVAPYLGLRKPTLKQLGAGLLLAVANQPVVSLLTWAAHAAAPPEWVEEFDATQRMLDAIFAGRAVPMLLTVAVAAPLGEELFFRGFALPALRSSWGLPAAVAVSGAMFSVLHLNKVGFIGLWEIGVVLALLRCWSGSLWPSILCHATNNAIAGSAFLLGWEDPSIPPPPWLLALGATLLVAGIVFAARVLPRSWPPDALEVPRPGREPARFRPLRAPLLEAIWLAAVVAGIGQIFRLVPPLPLQAWVGLSGAAALAALAVAARDAPA